MDHSVRAHRASARTLAERHRLQRLAECFDTLNQALVKVMAAPALREKLAKLGATPLNASAAAFDERIKADRRAWDPVLKTLELKTN